MHPLDLFRDLTSITRWLLLCSLKGLLVLNQPTWVFSTENCGSGFGPCPLVSKPALRFPPLSKLADLVPFSLSAKILEIDSDALAIGLPAHFLVAYIYFI